MFSKQVYYHLYLEGHLSSSTVRTQSHLAELLACGVRGTEADWNYLFEATRLSAATSAQPSAYTSRSVCLQVRELTLEASVAKEEEPVLRPTLESPSMLVGAPQGLDDPEFECGICLDATANIGFDSCGHYLCADCSIW